MKRTALIGLLMIFLVACTAKTTPQEAPPPAAPVAEQPPVEEQAPAQPPAEPQAPGEVKRVTVAAGQPLTGSGVYFIDLVTGAAEGWIGKDLGYSFRFPDSERWLDIWSQGLLIDRKTGKELRYDPVHQLVTAANQYLLFQIREKPQNRIVLTDTALKEIATFPVRDRGDEMNYVDARFAPDEKKALIRDPDRTLRIIDLSSGMETPLGPAGKEMKGLATQWPTLSLSGDGREIRVITYHYWTGTGEWRPDNYSDIQRFDWNGQEVQPLLTVPGSTPRLSPDGKWVAYDTLLDEKVESVVIADSRTGQPRKLVLSASMCYVDGGSRGERWFSDSSGVVLRTRQGYGILTLDGGLKAAPALKEEPIPAPDRPIFALRDRSVVDLTGKVLLKAPAMPDRAGDNDVWGATSRELIVTLPHGGHGGRCGSLLIMPPTIAPADLTAPLEFSVNTPGDCLKLRAEPGGKETTCLPHGTRLTATKGKPAVPPIWGEHALVAGERWIHVRTAAGTEGWVAFKAEYLSWTY